MSNFIKKIRNGVFLGNWDLVVNVQTLSKTNVTSLPMDHQLKCFFPNFRIVKIMAATATTAMKNVNQLAAPNDPVIITTFQYLGHHVVKQHRTNIMPILFQCRYFLSMNIRYFVRVRMPNDYYVKC